MADITNPPPPELPRNFEWKVPLMASRMTMDDIRRMHKIIEDKQDEDRDYFIAHVLELQPNETAEEFQARKEHVWDACRTTITVNGLNGEVIMGHGERFLDDSVFPERIGSIFFHTGSRFHALLKLRRPNSVGILLDFKSPPPLDWNPIPSAKTMNASNFEINAQNEGWGTSLHSRLNDFFMQRRVKWDWLHRQGIYDLLVSVFGIPLGIWFSYRAGTWIVQKSMPTIVSASIYAYLFIFALTIFRAVFSFARWTFPKVELTGATSSRDAYRALLAALLLGIAAAAIWDAVKAVA